MCNRRWLLLSAVVVFGLAVAATGLGADLPRLPKDIVLPQGKDSPGRVVFSHQTHIDMARPDCTTCHPKLFTIIKERTPTGRDPITHARMEKGRSCGACHNGKAAHGFDDCTSCHRQ
jgi:c(7)-type cytochrome triheme protein